MMQLGEKVGGEGGEVATKQQQQQQQQVGKDVVAAAGSNSKQLKRSLNAGDQLVPGALPKPTTPLPCPRCESLNTKFCYYNNYSVTQPRHFCRQCQRYWTAGGTLRNVPVGGGSRKKSRHSQRAPDNHHQHPQHHHHQPPAYMVPGSSFMQQQQQQPGMNPMSGVMPGGVGFPPLGFQHLMQPAAPDMTGFSFGMQTGGGSMYGAVAGDPGNAMPLQMRPAAAGGENSLHLNPPPPQYPAAPPPKQPELVENNNVDHVVGVKITKNGSSSSTIEEEGSTPTNGYSHSGYNEEGDAVSSMWHEMHDMDNVLFQ